MYIFKFKTQKINHKTNKPQKIPKIPTIKKKKKKINFFDRNFLFLCY